MAQKKVAGTVSCILSPISFFLPSPEQKIMPVKDSQNPVKRPKTPETVEKARYKEEKPSPFSIEGIRRGAVASNIVKVFLVASGVIMAGGFIISSLNPGPQLARPGGARAVNSTQTVAQVGDKTISSGDLANAMDRQEQFMRQYGQTTTAASYFTGLQGTLDGLTANAATIQAAKAAGINITDADVDAKINEEIAKSFQPQPGQSEAQLRRLIEAQYGSMEKAKTDTLAKITPEQREAIRDQLYVDKYQKQVEDANKVTEADYKRSQTKLKLRQIVVRPPLPKTDAKTPADPKAAQQAAQAKADKIAAQLKAAPTAANFAALAKAQSDDPASKAKGGEIGWKLPAELGADVGDALAKSQGQIVGPLADASGAENIFFVEQRALKLPADYAKNKKKDLEAFEKTQDDQAWAKRQDEIKKAATPAISSPALLAYKAQSDPAFFSKTPEEQKKTRAAAIEQYKSALPGDSDMENAAINYQLSQLYGAQGNKPEQLAALKAASEKQPNDATLRVEYARALRDAGQPKVALEQLKAASQRLDEAPSPPSPFGFNPDDATRGQIAAEFGLLKEPKLADAERAKIKPAAQPGMGGLMGGNGGIQVQPPTQ